MVERSQGVGKAWCMPWARETAEQLQATLDELDRVQREEYPVAGGRPRLATWPALAHSGRGYDREWERAHWDFGLACAYLAEFVAVRRINARMMVSIYYI